MKKILLSISGAVSFATFLILLAVTNHMGKSQNSQQMAARWSEKKDVAQVSCFFSSNSNISVPELEDFEHAVDSALQEASITLESENPSARLWADAYSAEGRIVLSSDRATLEADAVGIGGDFFLFHPQQLLYGSCFSGNDLNHDYCVIDEDAAWQLFGSNDVAGMTVYIGGEPHLVSGVVRRPQGRLEEAAGLDGTLVFVSYETLENLGMSSGLNHYEIVMPNPISKFALNLVQENLGAEEKEVEILENTSRYSLLNRLRVIGAFGTRSMNGKAILYPYWENIARGVEDRIAALTVLMLILLLYPVVLALVFFIRWWRHKGWTVRDAWDWTKDRGERFLERQRARRAARSEAEWEEEDPEKPAGKRGARLIRIKARNSRNDGENGESEEEGL